MANKPLTQLERIKSVTDLAIANNMSVAKTLEIYSKVQNRVYENYTRNGRRVKSDNSDLDNEAFEYTKGFLSLLN